MSLYDIPGPLSWDDVRDFVEHLDASSAMVSELNPDVAGWQGDQKTPMLLAHIADLVAGLSYGYTVSHMQKGEKKPAAPEPIPRPGIQKAPEKHQHWGGDAIPISEFSDWWDQK